MSKLIYFRINKMDILQALVMKKICQLISILMLFCFDGWQRTCFANSLGDKFDWWLKNYFCSCINIFTMNIIRKQTFMMQISFNHLISPAWTDASIQCKTMINMPTRPENQYTLYYILYLLIFYCMQLLHVEKVYPFEDLLYQSININQC